MSLKGQDLAQYHKFAAYGKITTKDQNSLTN